jgi:hypothetical protein
VTPCSLVDTDQHFGGACCFHTYLFYLKDRGIRWLTNVRLPNHTASQWFLEASWSFLSAKYYRAVGPRGTRWENHRLTQLVGKRLLGKPKSRWEANIKNGYCKNNVRMCIRFIWLKTGSFGGLLWTPYWTYGFRKRRGIFCVSQWIWLSQEGLCSVSWHTPQYLELSIDMLLPLSTELLFDVWMPKAGSRDSAVGITTGYVPPYPLDRRLGGRQSQSGHCGDENISLLLPGIEPRFLACPAHNPSLDRLN